MSLVAWYRGGSDDEWTAPIRGTGATKSGTPTYSACKYGNGINGTTTSNYMKIVGSNITLAQQNAGYTISFWWKPAFGSADGGAIRELIVKNDDSDPGGWKYWEITYNRGGGKEIRCTMQNERVAAAVGATIYDFKPTWSADSVNHVAITWNPTGSAYDKVRFYFNGVKINYDNVLYDAGQAWPATLNTYTCDPVLNLPYNAVIDNMKFHYPIATLEEIQRSMAERGGMNDTQILL